MRSKTNPTPGGRHILLSDGLRVALEVQHTSAVDCVGVKTERKDKAENQKTVTAILVLNTVLMLAALTGCNAVPGRPSPNSAVLPPDKILDAAFLYQQNCAGCHGSDGKSGAAVAVGSPVYLAVASDAAIRQAVANGVSGTPMPAFARSAGGMLTGEQIDVIVRGLRTRWAQPTLLGQDVPPSYSVVLPGDPKHGAHAYEFFCSSCHGPGGTGGPRAGSIVEGSYLALASDQGLRTMVIVGKPERGAPDWRGNLPGRPMSQEEVADVVAWLAAQRPTAHDQAALANKSFGGGSR